MKTPLFVIFSFFISVNHLFSQGKTNLGTNVNTPYTETAPIISADGKTLYFASKTSKGFGGQDIWYSKLMGDTTWSPAKNIGKPINNTAHNNLISITPDENTMLLLSTYYPDGSYKGPGVSVSNKRNGEWQPPEDMIIKDFYNYHRFIGFFLSASKNVLLMYAMRDDTRGGLDLYVCFREGKNLWSVPRNMGDTINTIKNEATPFLAADDKTLYFASDGHPGFGSYDIFMSKRLDDTWTSWSKPVNLGKEINTDKFDAYFSVPAAGEYAYLVSEENRMWEEDIFRIKIRDALKPEPVILLSGKVINTKTKEPLQAVIRYNELETGKEIGSATSGDEDGMYKMVLPAGKKYSFSAEKEGFYPESEHLDLTKLKEYREIERNLYLIPIESGAVITLKNIFFDFDKAHLKNESIPELQRLIQLLKQQPDMKIEISGHTDNQGDEQYNQQLSEERADAVKRFLTEKGISASRITAKGYGEKKPVASNDTEEGREKNRRVEIKIL